MELSTNTAAAAAANAASGYHCLFDFRAFVASPCAPGETCELFFSLYSKTQSRFLTEEYCLVLNHNGSPARDAERRLGKLRTLFADLRADDVQSGTYLVCRIVRNGSMKIGTEASSVGSPDSRPKNRRGSTMFSDAPSKWRSSVSIPDSITDDSASTTSGYEPRRTRTIDTQQSRGSFSSSKSGGIRRPFGCAVFELPTITRLTGDVGGEDLAMPIYVARDEASFATLHADIILHNERAYDRSPRADAIAFGLRLFHGPLDQVIREHPSMLLETTQTLRLGFPDVVPPGAVRNDLYIKLWTASFSTMFPAGGTLRVRKTVAPIPASTQVTLEVRRADGSIVADSLYAGGSGEPPTGQYNSIVYYHNDRPTFGELVKIALPQGTGDCHLFLSFRHRTREREISHETPFAFAYLPLFAHNASIKDGKHELILYHMEKAGVQPTPNLYFEAPSTGEPKLSADAGRYMTVLRDRISLWTFLCSTLHTQDDTLRALFAWQSADAAALCNTLQMFQFVGEDEIAKFLQPVLDALFAILVSHLGDRREEVDELVFKGLVKVLAMQSDRRFPSFGPIIAAYTSKHFAFASSASHLLRAMKAVMGRPESQEYRSLLKVWHSMFKFIIRSRELDRSRGSSLGPTASQIEADFKHQTREILGEINNIMLSSDKKLIGSQTLAVQHYADILPDLAQVFAPSEISEMVIEFTDTLTRAQGNLAVYKLLLILQIVKTLLSFNDTRADLIPAIIRWIKPHIGRYEEDLYSARNETQALKDSRQIKWLECNRLAISIMGWTVNQLQLLLDSPIVKSNPVQLSQEEDNMEYCLSILPHLLESYKELASDSTMALLERHRSSATVWKSTPDVFPSSHPFALVSHLPPPALLGQEEEGLPPAGTFRCGLAEVSVVIFTLVIATPRANIVRWFEEIVDMQGETQAKETLMTAFSVFNSIINFEAFPRQWLTLSGLAFTAVIRFLEAVVQFLARPEFVPPIEEMERFDVKLWTQCLELLCDLCASDELALEEQGLQRRRAAWIIAGDLRDEGAALLHRLWNAIGWQSRDQAVTGSRYGGYQARFTGLAERILTVCLSSHERLCDAAVDVLFSMIYAEYVLDGKFNAIQTEIFTKLELLFTHRTVSATETASRAYFVSRLRTVFEHQADLDNNFREHVGTFLDQVELFIDLLMAVRDLPQTPRWKEERVAAIFRLMEFFSRVGRDDLYVRFVHHLVSINVAARDWLGAGLALKLHADLYDWTMQGELVDEFHAGDLHLPAQTQFQRKEAIMYHVLDYLAEAEAYEQAAEICRDMADQHRRITFNVARISELLTHEAKLWERIGSTSRPKPEYFRVAYFGNFTRLDLDKEFVIRGVPKQKYNDFCDQMAAKHPDALIHRSKIPPTESVRYGTEPVIWITTVSPVPDLKQPVFAKGVNPNIQNYYKYNSINTFDTTRPYYMHPDEREPVLQWIEKTTVTTANDLPALQSRAEIIHIHLDHISPVQTAISAVRKSDRDLRQLVNSRNPDAKSLGSALNAAVDSKVNGGVPLYKKHFLDPDYVERHPVEARNVASLGDVIVDYARTIQEGFAAYQKLSRDIAFQEALRTRYNKVFAEESLHLPPIEEADLPPMSPALATPLASAHTTPHMADMATVPNVPRPASPALTEDEAVNSSGQSSYTLPTLRLGPQTPTTESHSTLTNPSISSIGPSSYGRSSISNGELPPAAPRRGTGILVNSVGASQSSISVSLSRGDSLKRANGHSLSKSSKDFMEFGNGSITPRSNHIPRSLSTSTSATAPRGTVEEEIDDLLPLPNRVNGRLHSTSSRSSLPAMPPVPPVPEEPKRGNMPPPVTTTPSKGLRRFGSLLRR